MVLGVVDFLIVGRDVDGGRVMSPNLSSSVNKLEIKALPRATRGRHVDVNKRDVPLNIIGPQIRQPMVPAAVLLKTLLAINDLSERR